MYTIIFFNEKQQLKRKTAQISSNYFRDRKLIQSRLIMYLNIYILNICNGSPVKDVSKYIF